MVVEISKYYEKKKVSLIKKIREGTITVLEGDDALNILKDK